MLKTHSWQRVIAAYDEILATVSRSFVRVTLVTNLPSPYRIPVYNRVHALLRERRGGWTVIYGAPTEARVQSSDAAPTTGTPLP